MPEFTNDQLAEALAKLLERSQEKDTALGAALEKLASNLDPDSVAKAQRRAQKPSNTLSARRSVLNPQGDKDYPRPVLPYKKIFVPYEAEPEDFTYEELELMALLKQGEYMVRRNDRSRVQLMVKVVHNSISGKPEQLHILSETAFKHEHRQLLPPMADYLRQMVGDAATDVLTMEERTQMVEDKELPVSVGE